MFTTFPREIAYPKSRKTIFNYQKLVDLVNLYNGRRNIYTSVYSFGNVNENKHVEYLSAKIDKMYFDLDGITSHDQIKQFHEYLSKKNIKHYMQFSGRGFNMFVFTKNEILENKKIALKQCQKKILEDVGIPVVKITRENRNNKGGCDKQILGDLARVCRLPGTFNTKGRRYCIPLTDNDIYLDLEEIEKIAKKQPCGLLYTYGKKLISLKEFDKKDYNIDYAGIIDKKIRISDSEIDVYLPCIINICRDENPGQFERFALVAWLSDELREGFPLECVNIVKLKEKIVKFIEKLNWNNYNKYKTSYQVDHIINNIDNQCKCKWMMENGICTGKCVYFDEKL